jgi:hypothetical protein
MAGADGAGAGVFGERLGFGDWGGATARATVGGIAPVGLGTEGAGGVGWESWGRGMLGVGVGEVGVGMGRKVRSVGRAGEGARDGEGTEVEVAAGVGRELES